MRLRWESEAHIKNRLVGINRIESENNRREDSRKKRNISETTEIDRKERIDQEYNKGNNMKRRRTDDYLIRDDIMNMRRQLYDLEYQMNLRKQRIYSNRQYNPDWSS